MYMHALFGYNFKIHMIRDFGCLTTITYIYINTICEFEIRLNDNSPNQLP